MTETLTTALLLRSHGISTIPVKTDKRPLLPSWKEFQNAVPSEAQLEKWFARSAGIALCAGKIQCLDFDEKYSRGIFPRFAARAEEVGLDYLLGELVRQKTPSGGFHLVWRCEGALIGNEKLASRPATEAEKEISPHVREFSMIETRGDGGYFLIAPSEGYALENGDWSGIPTISEEDRDALLSLARSFDERIPVEAVSESAPAPGSEVTPGDDYDFRADIPALLRKHGWKSAGRSGKYWTRPGKKSGISASWGVVPDRLFVFTSSTQFEPNHLYRAWHVYAVLECGGDYARAAGELRRQGFGGVAPKKKASQQLPWDAIGEPPAVESSEEPPAVEGCDPSYDPHGVAPTNETEDQKLWRLYRARAFDGAKVPPPLRPVFELGGVVICTPGNLTAITAQAKVGKSALVSALTAAAMTLPDSQADCLSAVGYNAASKAMVYVDTEQSPDDFWHAVNRAKRRAREAVVPTWLHAFSVADLPAQIARKGLAVAIARLAEAHAGVHSIIIDGVADLVLDVNDAEECNGIVAELHGLAIRYDCSIICVIHKNPGSDKVRGHLGSQIERKAETNLTLDKEDQVTVVWSAKQRRAPIDKATGPRFRWDDEMKMHVTAQGSASHVPDKVVDLLELAESVLKPGQTMSWKQLVTAMQDARSTPTKTPHADTAGRWLKAMKKEGILTVSFGAYQLNPAMSLQPA